MHQPLEVPTLLRLLREVVTVGRVKVSISAANTLCRKPVVDRGEQPTPHNLERFLGGYRLPERLHATKVVCKSFERLYPSLATRLLVRLWQGRQQNRRGYCLERLAERLNK